MTAADCRTPRQIKSRLYSHATIFVLLPARVPSYSGSMPQPSAAIIGAGIAGVAAARQLATAGWEVVIFEKSRGWGGRCATKRWEGQTIDHGAQFFTIRSEDFRASLFSHCGDALRTIEAPVITPDGRVFAGEPRYFHRDGNSRIVRDLGSGLAMHPGTPVERIDNRTILGRAFDAVISTAPLPQTFALAGLAPDASAYHPNLTLLLLYSSSVAADLRNVYAISDPDGTLAWSAVENHKPGRVEEGKTVLVIQASESFSRTHLEDDPSVWSATLRTLAEDRWGLEAGSLIATHPHRWRYARVARPTAVPQLPEGWIFAGDAAAESRLESAWHAGREAARRLIHG